MGASNSKQEPAYVYGSDVPIGFTVGLKEKLLKEASAQKEAKDKARTASSSPESVCSRDTAEEVEKAVAKELERILEKQQHDQLRSKDRQASTAELLGEIRDLSQQINTSPTAQSQTYGQAVNARNQVAACLRKNEGKALDCWKEVSEFKSLVATLEREFVAASH
ncbi:hypothetical protein GGH12_004506 [Coemansia sp. RSA 1822]|nr:hypothetical protein LPJ76_004429 [Coemansia sp. RSA 638]KAJ2119828.1 hypothetical protein IW147_005561 [Coemansia sp. RSA 720]KAJ2540637.1 hypothetical protein GGF49_004300 [Coemansia sp. RSA 1853]KAJ2560811.1 hypothetical protein GGH12_004506 [Coemansia sp. RSA 1822]